MDEIRSGENPRQTRTPREGEAPPLPTRKTVQRALAVQVLYTTHSGTLAALNMAVRWGRNLAVPPRVLILYPMPLTLPLERGLIPPGFLEERIRALASESPTEFSVQIHICRNPKEGLRQILPPHSLIVLGGRMCWWPTQEQRWARTLKNDGHEVIFVASS